MLVHALPLLSLLLSFTPGDTTGPARPTAEHPASGVELKVYAERSRATRLSFVATSVVTGAAMLATGIVLDRRADDVSQSVGIGLIAGGAAPLLFSALLLRPSPIETISANFEAASNGGQNPADLRRATEDEWMRAADSGHGKRIVAGTVEVALGAALSAAGTYLLLAKAGVGGMTRNGQYEVASFLIGPGVPIFSLGVRSLMVDSLEETSWRVHGATGQPQSVPFTIGMVPARGGLLAALQAPLW